MTIQQLIQKLCIRSVILGSAGTKGLSITRQLQRVGFGIIRSGHLHGIAADLLLHWPTLEAIQKQNAPRLRKFFYGHNCRVERSTAFKWIRILFACWKMRIPYNPQRYLEALQQRGSPLADLC
jgi:hypothetical protein